MDHGARGTEAAPPTGMRARPRRSRRSARSVAQSVQILAIAASTTGCVGVWIDLQATAYPALHAAPHPRNDEPVVGPQLVPDATPSAAIGLGLGLDFDDHRASRWAVGYVGEAFVLGDKGSSRQHWNDLRLDVTLKDLGEDARLRLVAGGGIGSGATRFLREDGTFLSAQGGSARLYSGPAYARFVGAHHLFSLLLGGSYVVLGAREWVVRGWGLTAHLTWTFSFVDTHPDVVFYRPLEAVDLASLEAAGKGLGCKLVHRTDTEVHLDCGGDEVELHQTSKRLHVHCLRSTPVRCEALFERILGNRSHP